MSTFGDELRLTHDDVVATLGSVACVVEAPAPAVALADLTSANNYTSAASVRRATVTAEDHGRARPRKRLDGGDERVLRRTVQVSIADLVDDATGLALGSPRPGWTVRIGGVAHAVTDVREQPGGAAIELDLEAGGGVA